MILFIFINDRTISPAPPIAPPARPLPPPRTTTGVLELLAMRITVATSSVLVASTTQMGLCELVLPERSDLASKRASLSVRTDEPSAATSRSRTEPDSSGLVVTEFPSQSYAKNNGWLGQNGQH
jgi:hypothetical protein